MAKTPKLNVELFTAANKHFNITLRLYLTAFSKLANTPMLPNLAELLNYKNPKLIARYQKDYPENKIPAEEALIEILKYFWLCEKHREDLKNDPDNEELKFDCSVHFEMAEIDDMWHTFLLFTIDYAEFCKKYFDHFIHHVPTTEETKKPSKKEFKKSLTRMLSYVYDNLGEETLKKWFNEYFTSK